MAASSCIEAPMNTPRTTPLQALLAQFALQAADTPSGTVAFREASGTGPVQHTVVLLHGIGSGSASWVRQLEAARLQPGLRVLAWDAPGYGRSTALNSVHPVARDYAQRVWQWLDALQQTTPVTLVGHSLGAIMAASAAQSAPQRVQRLVLLSPARGYGTAPAEEREQKRNDRLHTLRTLGPQGMAEKRGAAMLSASASASDLEFIRTVMAQIRPDGYAQATHLLAGADLVSDLNGLSMPVAVASGSVDTITPPAACQAVAAAAGVIWQDLGPVGHACALEAAAAVNSLLGLPTSQLQETA